MTPEEKKEAERIKQKQYKDARKEEIAAWGRIYRAKNKEKIAAKKKSDYERTKVLKPKKPKNETPRHKQPHRAEYMKRYREEKKEQIATWKAEYDKIYNAENKEKKREQLAQYRSTRRKELSRKAVEWANKNKDRYSANQARYYQENREKILAYQQKYAAENRDVVKARQKRWIDALPHRKRIYSHNRRARIRANGGTLSTDLAPRLMALQKGKCRCCGKKLKAYHIDHIIPVSKGGPNIDSNCQLLCGPCNLQKAAKDPYEFAQQRGQLFL
jgi:5-methylcytosine-specific restriction endonuclease McrA